MYMYYCLLCLTVPVKQVYIAAVSPRGVDLPIVDGGLVTLTQLRDDGVACIAVVDGSRRAPQVEVIIGDIDTTATGEGIWALCRIRPLVT